MASMTIAGTAATATLLAKSPSYSHKLPKSFTPNLPVSASPLRFSSFLTPGEVPSLCQNFVPEASAGSDMSGGDTTVKVVQEFSVYEINELDRESAVFIRLDQTKP